MMHLHYPELFRDTPEQAQAEALAARVYELTEFLVHVLKIRLTDLGPPTRVALHTSCSARRGMGVAAEHEGLIGQLGNVELVEPQRKEECCGFGGTFALKHPDISTEMVSEKARLIAETGVRELVSGDCGCLMNIAGRLGHQGSGIRGRHIASFLWERTHASDE
ncbi:MAG: hypothetical protein B0D87_00635 [Candidatus Sedimenticola endophacoides]|nr:MAG: hypothetical protein B0D87_00635 [Candidatus Sedimenticola endophacoides]